MKCLETFSTKKPHSESREQTGFPCSDSDEKLSPSTSRGVVCPKNFFWKKSFFDTFFLVSKKCAQTLFSNVDFQTKIILKTMKKHEKSRKWRFRSAGGAPIDLILQRNQLLMSTISWVAPGNHPDNFCSKNNDFLVVEATYNHSLYNGVLHIWSKNPSKIKIFGSETSLKCPDRLDIAQERTTGVCYELGASQDHPDSFTHKKMRFFGCRSDL